MREVLMLLVGVVGAAFISALGGWDTALQALVAFMIIDYVTGMIAVGIYKKDKYGGEGRLSSAAGFKVLFRKCMMLVLVYIGVRLDAVLYGDFVRLGVIIAFLANEVVSIIENAGIMGIKIPTVLQKALALLSRKESGGKADEVPKMREVHEVHADEQEAEDGETEKKEG